VETLQHIFPEADPELLEFAAGRPGILLEQTGVQTALEQAKTFMAALEMGMFEALQAIEPLEKAFEARWHPQVLRFLWRSLPSPQRLSAEQQLLELSEQLEQYANSSLVFSVFTLKLRTILGHSS
jgi:DNA polymerase III subunit delta'